MSSPYNRGFVNMHKNEYIRRRRLFVKDICFIVQFALTFFIRNSPPYSAKNHHDFPHKYENIMLVIFYGVSFFILCVYVYADEM